MLDRLAATVNANATAIQSLSEDIKELRDEAKEQGIRFSACQQASPWVVNLAFWLLATATMTTIVTAVVRK